MARKPRIHFQGAVYHVILRGNDGQNIFFQPIDYTVFESLTSEGVIRFGHRIHGYCWMPNHVHLVIEVGEISLSKIVQNISFRYTRWVNKKEKRIGHLFQGRFKAVLVNADLYLLELIRYVHLNPVRSGLKQNPDDFRWSSHRAYLGETDCSWLTTDWVLKRFSNDRITAQKTCGQFISAGIEQEHRNDFHSDNNKRFLVGDDNPIAALPVLQKMSEEKSKVVPLDLPEMRGSPSISVEGRSAVWFDPASMQGE